MDLFEYQGKQLFARYGIPVSPGDVADTVDEAVARGRRASATRSSSRRRCRSAGAARPAASSSPTNADEVRDARRRTSSAWTSRATSCKRVWIEHASDIAEEYYASFTLDRAAKKHLGMLSRAGRRRDRDRSPTRTPTRSRKIHDRPGRRARPRRSAARGSRRRSSNPKATDGAVDILLKLYRRYVDGDADLVEINPLILTPDGRGARARRQGHARRQRARSAIPSGTSTTRLEVRDEREQRGPRARACSTSGSTATSASSPTAPGSR